MTTSISDEQLAQIIAGIVSATPMPESPAAANTCRACGEQLDPVLGDIGLHVLCDEPTPQAPPSMSVIVKGVVRRADAGAARSQQRTIGPSEIGDPCDRFLAYKLLDVDPVNTNRDNWLAVLGTAMHTWLADAFAADNTRLGSERWLIEERVWLNGALSGSCDLFDTDTGGVFDHKLLGVTKLRKILAGEIPPRYRTQVHLYGFGHTRAGREVRTVNLIIYPRNDSLGGDFGGQGLHIWSEPYSEAIAVAALERIASVTQTAVVLELDEHPDRYELVPASPSEDCRYCPFFRPGNALADGTGCPGQPVSDIPSTIPGLLA